MVAYARDEDYAMKMSNETDMAEIIARHEKTMRELEERNKPKKRPMWFWRCCFSLSHTPRY